MQLKCFRLVIFCFCCYCKTTSLINFQIIRGLAAALNSNYCEQNLNDDWSWIVYSVERKWEKKLMSCCCMYKQKARTNVRMEFLLFHLKHWRRQEWIFILFFFEHIWKLAPNEKKNKTFLHSSGLDLFWRMGLSALTIMRESYC